MRNLVQSEIRQSSDQQLPIPTTRPAEKDVVLTEASLALEGASRKELDKVNTGHLLQSKEIPASSSSQLLINLPPEESKKIVPEKPVVDESKLRRVSISTNDLVFSGPNYEVNQNVIMMLFLMKNKYRIFFVT